MQQFMYWSISSVTLILTIATFILTVREIRQTGKRRRFTLVLLSSALLITVDILWVMCEDNILVLPSFVDHFLAVSYYAMTGFASLCCYLYSDSLLRVPGSRKKERLLLLAVLVPGVVNTLLALISIRTGWVYTIDPVTGIHTRGPLYAVHLVTSLLYLGLVGARALAKTILQKDSVTRNRYLSITLYSCLIIGLAPAQAVVPQFPFVNVSMTLAAMHAFFFINTYERGQISIYSQLQGFGKLFLSAYCVDTGEETLQRISIADGIRHSAVYREQKAPSKRPYIKAMHGYIKSFVHPDDRDTMYEACDPDYIQSHLSAEHPYYHVTYRHVYDGQVKWNRMFLIMTGQDDHGHVSEAIMCFMDVNQEQMLASSSEYFRNLFTNAATGAYQRILQINVTKDTVYHIRIENGNIIKDLSSRNIAKHLEHFAATVAPEFREEVMSACNRALHSTDLSDEISYGYKGLIEGKNEYGWFISTIRAMEYEGDRLLMLFVSDNTDKIKNIEMMEEMQRVDQMNSFIVRVLTSAVEYRSMETGDHVQRVTSLTRAILDSLMKKYPEYGITPRSADRIASAAALHDIGKIAIPDHILLKPGRLTDEEFAEMKRHTIYGCEMLGKYESTDKFYRYCYDICRSHHERYDGRGYPDALVGEQIPIWAQVVSIVDVYDALTNDRYYKKAYTSEQAVAMIDAGECGAFSPKILECFHDSLSSIS